jgi:hypothetical protein
MSANEKDDCLTLADALDATRWDYHPGADRKMLLRPVGKVFANFPWEVRPQYLGPVPIAEPEIENGTDDDTDTQPIEPFKE